MGCNQFGYSHLKINIQAQLRRPRQRSSPGPSSASSRPRSEEAIPEDSSPGTTKEDTSQASFTMTLQGPNLVGYIGGWEQEEVIYNTRNSH